MSWSSIRVARWPSLCAAKLPAYPSHLTEQVARSIRLAYPSRISESRIRVARGGQAGGHAAAARPRHRDAHGQRHLRRRGASAATSVCENSARACAPARVACARARPARAHACSRLLPAEAAHTCRAGGAPAAASDSDGRTRPQGRRGGRGGGQTPDCHRRGTRLVTRKERHRHESERATLPEAPVS